MLAVLLCREVIKYQIPALVSYVEEPAASQITDLSLQGIQIPLSQIFR